MFFGILNRMIFWELVRVFLLSVTVLTGLFLVGIIIQQATQLGASGAQLLRIVPWAIPICLPYTIPTSMLLASCLVYGRLAHDNEAVALKAAGVDLLTAIRPAFVLGLLASAVTAGLSYAVIPTAQRRILEEPLRDPEETLYNLLKRERCFRSSNMPYILYVRDVRDRRLIDVVVKRKSAAVGAPDDAFEYVARTNEAVLKIDTNTNMLVVDSNKWRVASSGTIVESDDNKPIEIALPNHLRRDKFQAGLLDRSQTQDWNLLEERAAEFDRESNGALRISRALQNYKPGQILTQPEQYQFAIDNDLEPNKVPLEPEERAKQVEHYKEVSRYHRRTSLTMEWELHSRPALALGCLLFGLIGCPIGLWANRADYLSIFVICFLPTIMVYYPIVMAGGGIARDGRIPMAVGVWAADAVAAVAAVALMWRLIRR